MYVLIQSKNNRTSEKYHLLRKIKHKNTYMKSTEGRGHDPHDTLNKNPFVAQKMNHKQTTLLFYASLCVMHKAISNLIARYNIDKSCKDENVHLLADPQLDSTQCLIKEVGRSNPFINKVTCEQRYWYLNPVRCILLLYPYMNGVLSHLNFNKSICKKNPKKQNKQKKTTQKRSEHGNTYAHSLQHNPGRDISLVSRNHRATLAHSIAGDSAFITSGFFISF